MLTNAQLNESGEIEIAGNYSEELKKAHQLADKVKRLGAYVENLRKLPDGIVCPFGVGGNDKYTVIIEQVKLSRNHTFTMNSYLAYTFEDSGKKIAFKGTEIPFRANGGIGGDATLELVAPFYREINKDVKVKFKPGTKLIFDCDGFKKIEANMELILSNKYQPVDSKGEVIPDKPIVVACSATLRDFKDITLSVDIDKSFVVKGLKDFEFTLKNAVLDMSEFETPTMTFPQDYLSVDFIADGGGVNRNLWKGLYIKKGVIKFPAQFSKSSSQRAYNDRLAVEVNDMFIDKYGFSGEFKANNIMNRSDLSTENWDFTFENVSMKLQKNELEHLEFDGGMNAPPLKENSQLDYYANMDISSGVYQFSASLRDDLALPMFAADMTLYPSSRVDVIMENRRFLPSLHLNGKLSVAASITKSKKFKIPDLGFENMVLSSKAPHFKMGDVSFAGSGDIEFAGFPVSINDIKTVEKADGTDTITGLNFDVNVNLNDQIGGVSNISLWGDSKKWKFKEVEINTINVDYEVPGSFSISGGVGFMRGDATYGDGFRGEISMKVIDKFGLDAVAVFGEVDGYRYFLADAFAAVKVPAGPITFSGFGGGAYQHMRQQESGESVICDFGRSLSGINYVPDKEIGLGIKASTSFNITGSEQALNADLDLEVQFTPSYGLKFVKLYGEAAFLSEKLDKGLEAMKSKVESMNYSGFSPDFKDKVPIKKAPITAMMLMEYNNEAQSFSADMSVYANLGIMKGTGPNNRAGWSSIYFSPETWYVKVGVPNDRIGIEFMGFSKMESYFMMGNDIPPMAKPDDKILSYLKLTDAENDRDIMSLSGGRGLAFGSKLEIGGKFELPPFYANFELTIGYDMMLKRFGEHVTCKGMNSRVGVNGWYAGGQAYAWVEGGVGLQARIFGRKRKFEIFEAKAGALLQAQGPNPFWMRGMVKGGYSVLGGLLSGECRFKFEVGEKCEVNDGNPFGEAVISQLSPEEGDTDVSVFAAPQALFTLPVNKEIELKEDDGVHHYRINLEEFSVKSTSGKEYTGLMKWENDNKVVSLDPEEPFNTHEDILVKAVVVFQQMKGGKWVDIKDHEGKIAGEQLEVKFKSGERPTTIDPEHIEYSYPIAKQFNFYKNEYDKGYIKLTENYSYLFSNETKKSYKQVIRFLNNENLTAEAPFIYKTGDNEIEYIMPADKLPNNKIYKFQIINLPLQSKEDINYAANVKEQSRNVDTGSSGNNITVTTQSADESLEILQAKELLSYRFRTSKYNTFSEKIDGISFGSPVNMQEYVPVEYLTSSMYDSDEGIFDGYEQNESIKYSKMLEIIPDWDNTDWYNLHIKKYVYENRDVYNYLHRNYKSPPQDVTEFVMLGNRILYVEDNYSGGSLSKIGGLKNRSQHYVLTDYMELKSKISNKLRNGFSQKPKGVEQFINTPPMYLTYGNYPLKAKYTLPGETKVVSKKISLKYNR